MPPDPSHYGSEKIIAAVVVLVLAGIAVVVPRLGAGWRASRLKARAATTEDDAAKQRLLQRQIRAEQQSQQPYFGLLLGADRRLSTSKTVAALWTLVVAYILLALIFVWPSDWSKPLRQLWPTYVLLLGGPYASLVLAKTGVSFRVANGTLQKPVGTGNVRLSDLVADDSGTPDLFDSQYVLFNVIAIVFVIDAFIRATLSGFPTIPEGLVLLTGGPAAVYLANKVTTTNKPVIFSVSPGVLAPGDPFTVYGQNFAPEGSTSSGATTRESTAPGATTPAATTPAARTPGATAPTATTPGLGPPPQRALDVGGYAAKVTMWTDSAIAAIAPQPVSGQRGAVGVTVTTAAGAAAYLDAAVTVLQKPVLAGLSAGSAAVNSQLTASGQWSLPAGAAPTILVDGLAAPVIAQPITGQSVTFTVPTLNGSLPRDVQITLTVDGLTSDPAKLQVTA